MCDKEIDLERSTLRRGTVLEDGDGAALGPDSREGRRARLRVNGRRLPLAL
jgi:hypothetical protein